MIDLHHVVTPNGHKVKIMLEETALPYKIIQYNLLEGTHLKPEFRQINPNGRLPALVDHDPIGGGPSMAVFDSGAMLFYLAEKSGRFFGSSPRTRHLAMQWLMWQMSGLGPMHGQAHHFIRYCPEDIPYAVNRYMNESRRLLEVLDRRLREADYLAEEYSIADMAVWPWIRAIKPVGIELGDYPNLQRWYERVGARPAVEAGARLPEGHWMTQTAQSKVKLTEEQWSNLFGENMLKSGRAT
ncbi:MAG: glutathione S-transferase N-terminal domain-containing protein [Hyphomonadaceae bacterium]|nr:glutathione S-transferase N-terminal domain-containing protein [Hyphomonadaceae bacterium]